MIVFIFGKQGSGKTTLNKKICNIFKKNIIFWSPFLDDNPTNNFKLRENTVIGISEFHIFLYYNLVNKKEFIKVFTGARHYNVDFVLDSQRPALIPRLYISQANLIYSFCLTDQRDIEYLSFFSPEKANKLKNLQKFEYIRLL